MAIYDTRYAPGNKASSIAGELDTSQGLQKVAEMARLGREAERVTRKEVGDENKFFSGGVISDVLDALNIFSYGVVGTLKGKGFVEGVRNRESFSDEDSLGKYGWQGKVAGLVLDIVVDPTTYVAPLKAVAKIPGVAKTLKEATKIAAGEFRPLVIGDKEFMRRGGGWSPLRAFGDKLLYGFSLEKKYADGLVTEIDKTVAQIGELDTLSKSFAGLTDDAVQRFGEFKADGSLGRRNITEVMRDLSTDDASIVKQLDDAFRAGADELLESGFISKEMHTKYADSWLTQSYDEFLLAKKGTGASGNSITLGKTYKERLKLTPEERMKMNQEKGLVTDMRAVVEMSLLKMGKQVQAARLQKYVGDNFGFTEQAIKDAGVDTNTFHKVADSSEFRINRSIDEKVALGNVTTQLRKLVKERRKAAGDSKELHSAIDALESRIDELSSKAGVNIGEAISGIRQIVNDGGISTSRKKVPTTEGQKALQSSITKWLNKTRFGDKDVRSTQELFDEFSGSREGLALAKAFENPEVMYQWRSPEEFFDAVINPQRKTLQEAGTKVKELTDVEMDVALKRGEDQLREKGKLGQELDVLKGTNLKLVDDALIKLEEDYSDLLFQKNNILDTLNVNEMGNLAGKYVPNEVWEMVKGTFNPEKQFGETAVMVFKHAKVIWSPAAFVRNSIGAAIANWWVLGIGAFNPVVYAKAAKELSDDGPIIKEMVNAGFVRGSGYIGELRDNYITKRLMGEAITRTSTRPLKVVRNQLRRLDRFLVDGYGKIDDIAKVAAFTYGKKKGMTDSQALAKAYEATFNYSQVTPFVHKMRRAIWGAPFITFSLKAAPLVGRTIVNNPGRVSFIGKARNALFNAAGVEAEQEAEVMPGWMRDDTFMLRLPWKDDEGRSMYFDLSYIVPFGALVSGDAIKNPIGQNPVLQVVKELSQNKTFGGYKVFRESDDMDTVLSDIFVHTSKMFLPNIAAEQLSQGYKEDGSRVPGTIGRLAEAQRSGYTANQRTIYQEAAKVLGATVTPFNLESKTTAAEYTKKDAIRQLLVQNGVIKEFTKAYIPDDSTMNNPAFNVPNVGENFEARPLGR